MNSSIFLGDLNARHENWGDSTNNLHGLELYNHLPYEFSIINYGDTTFLSFNGNSVIVLIIVIEKMTKHTFYEQSCDYDLELFTGAPRRGHVHVLLDVAPLDYSKVVNDRLWLEKVDWASWTKTLEELIQDKMEIDDCNETWSRIKQSISEASDKFIETKSSCHKECKADEYHWVMVCENVRDIREKLIQKFFQSFPNITKFDQLMNSMNIELLENLSVLCGAICNAGTSGTS